MMSRLIQIMISLYHHSLPNNEQADNVSASDNMCDSDTEEEVEGALETTLSMICPTRLGRIITLITSRMADFLQELVT